MATLFKGMQHEEILDFLEHLMLIPLGSEQEQIIAGQWPEWGKWDVKGAKFKEALEISDCEGPLLPTLQYSYKDKAFPF